MANMSYCRFENTVRDMDDCIKAIENGDVNGLSSYEVIALEKFLVLAEEILFYQPDIEAILDEYLIKK
jgi:hypothetical protein|tara:strand:+ start:165 stop:368 length:204 start_codon:yes stop_codon:yes gene_type:complete